MTDTELIELRREKWRVNGNAVRTLEDARSFIESVGLCLMFPLPSPKTLLVPTFVAAFLGSDDKLPTLRQSLTDSRAVDPMPEAPDPTQVLEVRDPPRPAEEP